MLFDNDAKGVSVGAEDEQDAGAESFSEIESGEAEVEGVDT